MDALVVAYDSEEDADTDDEKEDPEEKISPKNKENTEMKSLITVDSLKEKYKLDIAPMVLQKKV